MRPDNIWSLSGGIVGDVFLTKMTLRFAKVSEINVVAFGSAGFVSSGGIFSWLFENNVDISESFIQYSNISSLSAKQAYCGGLLGYIVKQPAIISNSYVKSIALKLTGIQSSGLIQGYGGATLFTVSGVYTEGINSINGIVINNCANVITQSSQNGC
ncbi:Hypothetical_protein [Hexamita inflata]|uniref:Hypothetical_protein n=1 Tax=Hexamita inflata TaxID=28002 RepID=A0AA86QFN6_9EUKA|nr:Hypothetical protein HINF_LOCUS39952 [Hexamita inflata]